MSNTTYRFEYNSDYSDVGYPKDFIVMAVEGDDIVWDVLVERFLHFLQSTGYVIDAHTIDAVMDTIAEERGRRFEDMVKRNKSDFEKMDLDTPTDNEYNPDIDFVYE
jgi:hypothetical protein